MTLRIIFLLALLHAGAPGLLAISGSRPVAFPGQPVLNEPGWPSNALALINDQARTEGWNPWFSGHPSDVHHYAFKLVNSADANRLIQRLAAIPTNVFLKLSPAREASHLGFITRLKEGSDHAAVFALGNQRVLDQWRLNSRAKTRTANTSIVPSLAFPPTLTLYVGHPAINSAKLEIPEHVSVSAEIPDAVRKLNPGDATLQAIDTFVADRKIKRPMPAALQ